MYLQTSLLPLLPILLSLTNPSHSAYTLEDDYSPSTFFSQFTFFTDNDPTNGYVDYISQSSAQFAGLINTNNNQIYMGVDSTTVATGRGRKSVRITSKAVYNHALIVLDLEHMPGSICGVWPAFWTVGPNWPNSGEIDIIEGVSGQVGNSMALHTGPGCSVSGSSGGSAGNTSPNTGSAQAIFSGTIKTPDCNVAAAGQPTNAGCAITTSDASTYGSGLNNVNGGVYATEWNSNVIRIWFFPRGQIPSDIDSGSPNPSSWGAPLSSFGSGSCNIDSAFKNQQIVFDTTFCGDWAGSVWSTDGMCSGKAKTCQEYVQNNPAAFKDAYWAVNHLKVYTNDGGSGAAPVPSASKSVGVSASASVPVGSGVPPVGSMATPTPGYGTGAPKPVPVPGPTDISTTTTRGQQQPLPSTGAGAGTSAGMGTYVPPIATSPTAQPQPQPSQIQPSQPQPSQPSQAPLPSNLNPSPQQPQPTTPAPAPLPTAAAPTTMATIATSKTNNWGGNNNGDPWTWGGGNGNGYYTRTRGGWGGSNRMASWGGNGGVQVRDEGEVVRRTPESGVEGAVAVRSLVRPVVRRETDEVEEQEKQRERERMRRSHLGRHKERRWGHAHDLGR